MCRIQINLELAESALTPVLQSTSHSFHQNVRMVTLAHAKLPFGQFADSGSLHLLLSIKQKLSSSNLVIGLRSSSGVVLAVEDSSPSLGAKLHAVEGRIGVAVSGTQAAGQHLVDLASAECSTYKSNFGMDMTLRVLQSRLASYLHGHTISSVVQPVEASLLCAGYDESGPLLYAIEPSGESRDCLGYVSGRENRELAIKRLNSQNLASLNVTELAKEATVLAYLANGKMKMELKLGIIGWSTGMRFELVSPQLTAECHAHASMTMHMLSRWDK